MNPELLKIKERLQKIETSDKSTVNAQQLLEQDKIQKDYINRLKQVYVEEWYHWLQPYTFPTTFIQINREHGQSIVSCYQRYLETSKKNNDFLKFLENIEDDPILVDLQKKIDEAILPWNNSGFFVRLSSRSPKYSKIVFSRTKNYITEQLRIAEAEFANDSNLLYNAKQIIGFTATLHGLRCSNGKEALELLCSSERIRDDLVVALESGDFNLKLCVRQWVDIPIHMEFRLFINNGQLNVLIQDWDHLYFKELENGIFEKLCDLMKSFYETTIKPLIPLQSYVLDFGIVQDKIYVIELNPFGETSGAAPFNWNDPNDRKILLEGPYSTRKVDAPVIGGHDDVILLLQKFT